MTRRNFCFALIGIWPFSRRKHAEIAGVRFRRIRNGGSERRYLHIHGNEKTAREVLLEHMTQYRGTAHLVENDVRNVPLLSGALDPNRMFSRAGAEKNLKALNPKWDAATLTKALDALDRDRPRLLRDILPAPGSLLVALHNNSPSYSVKDEVPISDRVALNDAGRPHEFLLCTDPGDFELLAKSPFNVVLQRTAPPDDDGSLSRLMAARKARYVNIEAAHGEKQRQTAMLHWLEKNLL